MEHEEPRRPPWSLIALIMAMGVLAWAYGMAWLITAFAGGQTPE